MVGDKHLFQSMVVKEWVNPKKINVIPSMV